MTTVTKGKILQNDIEAWNGVDSSVSRKDSTGGTIVGQPVGREVDVLSAYGGGTRYTRGTIVDCVNRIGSSVNRTLLFAPGTWTIDDDLTIGSNFTCRIPNGCVFSVSSGKTLTFSGPTLRDGNTWTSGSGTVTESGTRYISGKLDMTGAVLQGTNAIVFEGSGDDAYETTFVITNPTADRTITFPDSSVDLGAVVSASASNTFTGGNTFSGNNTFSGDNDIKDTLEIYDPSDTTKKIRFDAGGITTGNTRVLTAPDYDMTIGLVSGTVVATTSGTSHDFTGIPSWVKKITISLSGVSTNGTSVPLIQLGDSGGIETTGYLGSASGIGAASAASTSFTTGVGLNNDNTATVVYHGSIVFSLLNASTNTWVADGGFGLSDQAKTTNTHSSKSLSGTLTQIRLTTVNGTDAFDAGSVNILYE